MRSMTLATILLVSSGSHGAEEPVRSEPVATPLDTIVVTATRSRARLDEVLVPMIVIDRAQIERTGGVDLADILRFQTGIEIGRTGGPGQQASVFTRGTDSNHTLVLIDGVEFNPGTLGGAALQNLPLAAIEQIEIVKGPRSSLYGSEAIGGVINVITRRTTADGWLSARAGGGRYATQELAASGGMSGPRGAVSLAAQRYETDGFPARAGSELDRGYENTSLRLTGRLALGEATQLEMQHWQAAGEVEYFDFLLQPLTQDQRNAITSLALETGASAGLRHRVRLSHMVDDVEQQQSADFVRTERDTLEWEGEYATRGAHHIVTGVTYTDELTSGLGFGSRLSDGDGDVDTETLEVWLADEFDLGPHAFLLAGRLTDHTSFGTHATWNLEYGLALGDGGRLSAGIGSAFRAPDSTDRFGFGGNPQLEPEESTNVEIGWRRPFGPRQQLSLQAFQNDIENLIEFSILDPIYFIGENRNIGRARIRGIEAVWQYRAAEWDLNLGASLQDPQDRTSGTRLLRRARHNFTANAARRIGALELGLDVLYAGDRVDFGFPEPTPLADYVLANLSASYRLGAHWEVRGRLENLLDENYALAAGFRTPERSVFVSAVYTQQ